MNCCSRFPIVAVAAAVVVAGSLAFTQATKDKAPTPPKTATLTPPAGHGDMQMPQLPKGWTEADMQACSMAAMPGEMHKQLQKGVGVWNGKSTMWMAPDMPPATFDCTSTVTSVLDGRFTRCEVTGDMPGMGPFNGIGYYGFDNVSKKYQSTWIDNCSTGIMNGNGDASSDGKTMTWISHYNCPITQKPTTMREVDTWTGKDTMTFELYGIDPKTGKEFKMMKCDYTRKPGTGIAAAGSN